MVLRMLCLECFILNKLIHVIVRIYVPINVTDEVNSNSYNGKSHILLNVNTKVVYENIFFRSKFNHIIFGRSNFL